MKTQLLKPQIENKHMVAKSVEVEKAIKKAKALQQEYNELNHVYFKTHNDLKVLHLIELDWLTRDYGKMEAINVQWEKNLLELENTYLQQKE